LASQKVGTVCYLVYPKFADTTVLLCRDADSIHLNTANKIIALLARLKKKEFGRIFLALQQLQADDIRQMCKSYEWSRDVLFYIVDEAHIVIEWGGSFRPFYLFLPNLRHIRPATRIPIKAVTESMPVKLYDRLEEKLALDSVPHHQFWSKSA
jgi:superfamily II DNA helicase RecQ